MSDQSTTDPTAVPAPEPAPEPAMQVVLEPSEEFAPRTRKSTSDTLIALKPSLDAAWASPGTIYTIVKGVTATRSASIVSLLNEHYGLSWTFAARSTTDGTALVQALYDPSKPRKVRTVTRKAKPGKTPTPK